jgi:hypothetical protein
MPMNAVKRFIAASLPIYFQQTSLSYTCALQISNSRIVR